MKLSKLLQSVTQVTAKDPTDPDGTRWYPVRPQTAENTFLRHRIRAAMRVLLGKSDAVEWDYPMKEGK
jgi:hypothetical protein